jgi:hypothetical protein
MKTFKKFFESTDNTNNNDLDYYNVEVRGIPFRVGGYYIPGEKEVMYNPDGSGEPESQPSFEIVEIYTKNEGEEEDMVDSVYLAELGVKPDDLEYAVLQEISDYKSDSWNYREDMQDDI